jgi:two-component sensor histidine kinase
MKKPDLLNILSNPFFLAAVFILPVIIFFTIKTPKYVSEILGTKTIKPGDIHLYEDLNNDGFMELIRAKYNAKDEAAVVIEKDDKVLQQTNLDGKFPDRSSHILIDDYNTDGTKEIFVFTHADAKIWLYQLDPLDTIQAKKKKIYVDSVWVKDGSYDIRASFFGMEDMNGDGVKELIFNLRAGFSVYPRRVCYYDIENDTLLKSVVYGAGAGISQIADIDGDSLPEIIMGTNAINNMMGKYGLPWPDNHSWIMVFDHKLKFKFEPVLVGGVHSAVTTKYIKTQGISFLISERDWRSSENSVKRRNVTLQKIDIKGNVKRENEIELIDSDVRSWLGLKNRLLFLEQDQFWTIDTLLRKMKFKNKMPLKKLHPVLGVLDKSCGYQLFNDYTTMEYYFVDTAFNHFIPIGVMSKKGAYRKVSQLYPIDGNPYFAIQDGEQFTRFIVKKNPHYIYRFGYYAGGYLILLTFIFLIQWLQRGQMTKHFETERTISRLRLRAIKNEISPHFTLNVLNSIVALAYKGEPDKVYKRTMQFSKLIQASLLDSEKMTRTLEDELEFVINFLELQKLRFSGRIEHQLIIDANIDQAQLVPKMVIHTYAENSVKHGLANLEKDSLLKIRISQTNQYLIIEIDDNGVGREHTREFKSGSTGKGQKIMQEYYQVFNKSNKQKITCKIVDKKDGLGKPDGTRVVVKIPLGYSYIL